MFINRAMTVAQIMVPDGYDDYGERSEYTAYGSCNAAITLYTQSRTDDARYKDVTHFCITDIPLSDDMVLVQGGKVYKVELVNTGARRYTAYLNEKTELENDGNTYEALGGFTYAQLEGETAAWP